MIEILKKYKLAEITKRVNKRILTYDFDFGRVVYTYCGINKEEFKLTYEKWGKIMISPIFADFLVEPPNNLKAITTLAPELSATTSLDKF